MNRNRSGLAATIVSQIGCGRSWWAHEPNAMRRGGGLSSAAAAGEPRANAARSAASKREKDVIGDAPSRPHAERGDEGSLLLHAAGVEHGHLAVTFRPARLELQLPGVIVVAERRLPVLRQPVARVHVHLDEV